MKIKNPKDLWEETSKRYRKVTDKLGRHIDKGIMDTVVALNILGLHTDMSCQGHIKYPSGPWVDIEAPEVEPMTQKLFSLKPRSKAVETLRGRISDLNRVQTLKVPAYIAKFYRKHKASFEDRLILSGRWLSSCRIENQGNVWLAKEMPRAERAAKLKAYQKEMQAFTVFLKKEIGL